MAGIDEGVVELNADDQDEFTEGTQLSWHSDSLKYTLLHTIFA